ncbi:Protein Flattop [Orchesella cincta]|uniref:Cilia- and flagella-associated protein 126 n=1 Tax=Orchesella cincta TaxID=48709 RepID=A0A1D2NKQ0_ORCCI|nr:Protein Flattop [Orchesella cincta]
MSTIYSAGQYDDAFSPKKLGNWEAGAKDIIFKPKPFYLGTVTPTEIIADSRGHLLPWIPRDKSKTWGMLNCYTSYESRIRRSMMDQAPTVNSKKWKLPRFQRKKEADFGPEPDHVLEYLQELGLPIIWIIGPPTKHTYQKRKQFSKQLAATLGFSYVNLDEKIVEWKERQTICTCDGTTACSHASLRSGTASHSLAGTSIAPSKLPTNVQPLLSSNMPSPQSSRPDSYNSNSSHIQSILESQRITFDTALPIERNKIMELYKFAMVEGLPCGGFVMDMVPLDLVEGIAFEKTFYPAALAIYFTEGAPQPKNKGKLKERRITATSNTAATAADMGKQKILSPIELLMKARKEENVFLRMRHHKRLGTFSPVEGEKICRQYGNKTIRVINAEDVENETMEFLNELVRKNLEKYPLIMDGQAKLDIGGAGDSFFNRTSCDHHATFRSFNSEEDEEEVMVDEVTDMDDSGLVIKPRPASRHLQKRHHKEEEDIISAIPPPTTLPPALVAATTQPSECSVFTIPNIFHHDECEARNLSSGASSPHPLSPKTRQREETMPETGFEQGGAGDIIRETTDQLWEKIIKLESKVAEVNPEEDGISNTANQDHSYLPLPPPTAYAHEDDEKLTAAIRNAMHSEYVPPAPLEYDYGAGGDCGPLPLQNAEEDSKNDFYSFYQHQQRLSASASRSRSKPSIQASASKTGMGQQTTLSNNQDNSNEDPFYDS